MSAVEHARRAADGHAPGSRRMVAGTTAWICRRCRRLRFRVGARAGHSLPTRLSRLKSGDPGLRESQWCLWTAARPDDPPRAVRQGRHRARRLTGLFAAAPDLTPERLLPAWDFSLFPEVTTDLTRPPICHAFAASTSCHSPPKEQRNIPSWA